VLASLVLVGLLSFVAIGVASGAGTNLTAGQQPTLASTYAVSKYANGSVAKTDPTLLGLTGSKLVPVMIKYAFKPTASYAGGLKGLEATSPRVTHKSFVKNALAVTRYERFASAKVRRINLSIKHAVHGTQLGTAFTIAYGGVAARVPANEISKLLAVPGVVAVQKDALNQPQDDNTSFIGATNVWPSLGGQDNAGSNVVVGVIDTGIWPESPYFVDRGLPAPPHPLSFYHCDFGDGTDVAHLGPTFACNNKLIGAYNFTQTYMSIQNSDGQEFCNNGTHVCSARDSEGHGTHTSSTAAGDRVDHAPLYGVDRGPVSGIAPGAHVIMFRVCLVNGCFSSDSVNAVQRAIHDGVNVLNFSISGGASPYTDPVELAFLDAFNAGISVNASAGNSGPGAATSDHGGPWVTTVGASTGPRSFTSMLHLTADGGATLDISGVTLTNGVDSPTPVVLASSLPGETARCENTLAAGTATGKVVVCARGNNGRADKGRRVAAGGAAGMILYNQSAAVTDLESDNHYLPAIQTQFNANAIASFVSGHTNVMATWAQGTATPAQPDVMASFSSRGPLGDWIKPDVTAPGVQVLAGTTPQPDQTTADNGPPGNLFMAIAGTSMSSPHAAGVSALVKAAHPTWTPAEIKSALMTSSVQGVVKEDGVTPADAFDMGAGSIRADRAVNPTLVFNATTADMVAAGNDPLHRIDLNIPSIDATTMSGSISTHRTAINVSGKKQVFDVQITEPAGVTITVGNDNHTLQIDKDGTLTFPISIDAPSVANGQYQGRIDLVPNKGSGANKVTIPVAFVKKQGAVTLTNNCSPLSFAAFTGASHCTARVANFSPQSATAALNIADSVQGRKLQYENIGAPGSVVGRADGVQWSGSLTPAIPPQVTGFTLGAGEPFGYVPLSALGVSPVSGVGDDTISNFTLGTPVLYGAEQYTGIGVVSNGYVVLGGGTSADIVFTPQHFPNAARPNNVIAPMWSDLNPSATGAGHLYVASLSSGTQRWLVVDWEGVKNFGNATTHSFEIWLANTASSTGEQVTIAYGPDGNAGSGDPDSGQNWGAENRDGTSGANISSAPANSTQYRVNVTGLTAGGAVAIPYDITSDEVGTWDSVASMTSNRTPGITQVVTTLTVTP
jgi:subtilisin family serine protease